MSKFKTYLEKVNTKNIVDGLIENYPKYKEIDKKKISSIAKKHIKETGIPAEEFANDATSLEYQNFIAELNQLIKGK